MSKAVINLLLFLVICCSFALSDSTKSSCTKGNEKVYKCKPSDREGDFCPEYYRAVCGYRPGIVCKKAPCNHVTFPNECFACHDVNVESYSYGECTQND